MREVMSIYGEYGEAVITELKMCANRIANLITKLHTSSMKSLRQEVKDAMYRHEAAQYLAETEQI